MNKKQLVAAIVIILLLPAVVFCEVKTYKVDLDGNGKEENVTTEDKFDVSFEGIVTVSDQDGKNKDSFSMPDHLGEVNFISLNKDGIRQIVAYSYGGAHYTNIAIYGYLEGKLYCLFQNGSACSVETDFSAEKPVVRVGRADWEKEGWNYASGEPLWQVYAWDKDQGFIYDKNLSTTKEIDEDQEVARYVNKVMGKDN